VNGSLMRRSELTRSLIAGADCVAILTPHSRYDLAWVVENASMIFDARNAFAFEDPKVIRL